MPNRLRQPTSWPGPAPDFRASTRLDVSCGAREGKTLYNPEKTPALFTGFASDDLYSYRSRGSRSTFEIDYGRITVSWTCTGSRVPSRAAFELLRLFFALRVIEFLSERPGHVLDAGMALSG